MKANLDYSAYSNNLEKATIPMTTDTHDLQLITQVNTLDDGTVEKKFSLSVVDKLTNEQINILLSSDEVRQFIALVTVFLKQIG